MAVVAPIQFFIGRLLAIQLLLRGDCCRQCVLLGCKGQQSGGAVGGDSVECVCCVVRDRNLYAFFRQGRGAFLHVGMATHRCRAAHGVCLGVSLRRDFLDSLWRWQTCG